MDRHKPLPTTRNIKYSWSQCVLVSVSSHDNSTEAGERPLEKGLSSCHPGFEGPKGVIIEGFAPTLSGFSLVSVIALWSLFFTLMTGSCYFRGL